MSEAVPFAVQPKEVPLIWGGDALVRRFHKPGNPNEAIGESWECWDENLALGGPYAGESIAAVRAQLGAALMGSLDPSRPFPILTKFIDARQPLSVQVHPDDAYAQRVEHQPNGKTECWFILDAQANAEIVLGWSRDTSRDEYVRRVADGTLGDILRRVPVKAGDAYYLPAGTVHSIGAGIVLFEAQQASDLTYRIFDWNRIGADGKPRTLHVDKAADVLDYRASSAGALARLEYSLDGLHRTALVADRRFVLERVSVEPVEGWLDLEGMPLTATALDRPLTLRAMGSTLALAPYETCLLPASLGRVSVACEAPNAAMLSVAPPAEPDALAHRFARAGIGSDVAAAFLAQF